MVDALQNIIDNIAESAIPLRIKVAVAEELGLVREAIDADVLTDRKKLKSYRTRLYAVVYAIHEAYEQYALPDKEANDFGKAIGNVVNRLIMPRSTPQELDVRDRMLADKHIDKLKKVEAANAKYRKRMLKAQAERNRQIWEAEMYGEADEHKRPIAVLVKNKEKESVEMLTKEVYLQRKAEGLSEEKIVEKYGFKSPYYLDKWKEAEGISKGDVKAVKDVNNLNCSDGFSIIPKEVEIEAEEEVVNSERESTTEDEFASEAESTAGEEPASEAVVEPDVKVPLEVKAESEVDEPKEYAETYEVNEIQENVELEYPCTSQVVKLLVATGVEIELAKRDFRLRGKDDYVDCVVHAATQLFSDKQITSKQLIDTLADYK